MYHRIFMNDEDVNAQRFLWRDCETDRKSDVYVLQSPGKIGVCGDIQEMYQRIFMNEEDVNAQQFLWRDCETDRKPDVYVLQVLAFGPVCAPSSAVYVKNRNAERLKDQYPRAHASIKTDYVDNRMESYHQEQDAFINQLYHAATINIHMCYFPNAPYGKFILHVLCDASEKAFATVIYLECIEPEGLYDKPALGAAKARVASLKALSVARLELQAPPFIWIAR